MVCIRSTDADELPFYCSWQDGIAFCALVHRIVPSKICLFTLKKERWLENLALAFEIASSQLVLLLLFVFISNM